MKKFLHTALLIGLTLGGPLLNAQTHKTTAPSHAAEAPAVIPTTKSNFINSQNYLSPSALTDFSNNFGDSLAGFDEAAVKAALMDHNVMGQELITATANNRRDYINRKYSLGYYAHIGVLSRTAQPAQPHAPNLRPIGGTNTVNTLPCINEGFENTPVGSYAGAANATAIQGWTLSGYLQGGGGCQSNAWAPGAAEAWIVQTPIFGLTPIGTLPNSPLGGSKILQLNDYSPSGQQAKIKQTFPVTSANTLFQFAFAGAWWDGGHPCCEQPGLKIAMYDCGGAPLTCSSLSLNPIGIGCGTGASGYSVTSIAGTNASWTNWQVKYIDLTPFVGSCVTLEIINGDCTNSGHWGVVYFDTQCGGQVIGAGLGGIGGNISGPVSYCAGSNQAVITAPLGYASYQWITPNTGTVPAYLGGTAPSFTVNNPVPGSVYTVNLVTGSGCFFTSTDTIKTSQVNIMAIGASSTCAGGGASGTATVVGNGSGSGYTYNWQNSSGTSVGTTSMITGLTSGIYSITLGGLGVAGCGQATGTVQVGVTATPTTALTKPYCGSQAFLGAPYAGTNFQWFYGGLPINPSQGGTAANYTVTNPAANQIYWLSYNSIQGCRDSIQFTLYPSVTGSLAVPGPGTVCPSGSNGTATITLAGAPGSPSGLNGYTVTNISAPAYTSAISSSGLGVYNPTGLSAGTYSLRAFDGSCYYNTTFNVSTLVYTFQMSPPTATLCSGSTLISNMVFPIPPLQDQYTYYWTPSTFLSGNTQTTALISPTTAPGVSTTIVYSITATSTLANCPVTRTMALTVLNAPIPTFSNIPALCDIGPQVTINATPPGGTFATTNNPGLLVGSLSGIISPTYGAIGSGNTFSYTAKVSSGTLSCYAQSTGTFEVSHYNTPLLTGTILPLCVTSPTVNLMNLVQNTVTGVWGGPGVGTGPTANIFNPANPTFTNQGSNTVPYVITYSTFSSPNPTACAATSTLQVYVTKLVTPTITPVSAFCTNHVPISFTVTPAGGGWSGTGIPNNGVLTPSNIPAGTIQATYTVSIDACINTKTTNIMVGQYNDAGFTGTVPPLCFNNSPFNLNTIAISSGGAWAASAGPITVPGITGSLLSPAIIAASGYTQVTVTHTAYPTPASFSSLCTSIQTLNVTVDNPPTPTIIAIGALCSAGAPVQLVATPNIGSWVPTQYISSTGLFTPSLGIIGNNSIQYVIGSATCSANQNGNVSVEAFVPAATVLNHLPDQCASNALVSLTPFSSGGTWTGPGVTGTSFHPSVVGQGNFILTHNTASSPSGLCPDQATVAVNVYSLQTPVLNSVPSMCNSGPITAIHPVPAGGLFGGINTNAVNQQGLFNPAQAVIGNNIISYTVVSGPCTAYAQTTITIEQFIPADLTGYPKASYCKNEKMPLNLDQFVQNPGGTWGGAGVNGNAFIFANANVGNNNIVHYMTTSRPNGLCSDTSDIRINVADVPVISVSRQVNGSCVPVKVQFLPHTNALGEALLSWDFGDGNTNRKDLSPENTYTAAGTYSVVFTVAGSCTAQTVLDPITVYDNPKASFSIPEEVSTSNTEIQVNNLTGGNNQYQWQVAGLATLHGPSPSFSLPATPGRYPVTLTATNVKGCSDAITKVIEVKNEFNVFIPGSFTPNNDNLNDKFIPVFTPYGLDASTFEMEIYDRWGTSLYRTKDVNKGWDGSIQNKGSELLKEDVYVYKVRYKDMDGNIYSKIGHVSLIK